MDASRRFVTTEPHQVIEPVQTYEHEEVEERMMLCGRIMWALIIAEPSMVTTMTSVPWSLYMTAPMEQLRRHADGNLRWDAGTDLDELPTTCES